MQRFALPRGLILLLVTVHFALWSTPSAFPIDWEKRDKEFLSTIQPLLKAACFDCHSGAEASAGLALNHFQTTKSIFKQRHTWGTVIKRLEIGDMPPADAEPLKKEDRQRLIDWLKSALNDIECGLTPNPGNVTLRRLNRVEYRNSVRDVFGIDYKLANSFPGDDVGYGFDNIGDVLTLPPLLMEKYVLAAEEISQQCISVPKPGPVFESPIKPAQLTADKGGSYTGDRFVFASNGKITIEETFPWSGAFSLEMGLGGSAAGNELPKVRISVNGKKVSEIAVDTKQESKANTYYAKVKGSAKKKTVITVEFINDFFVAAKDGSPAQDRNLYIYDMKLVGQKPTAPIPDSMLPESHKRIIKERPLDTKNVAQAASTCLKPVVGKAFRRPPKVDEVERLVKLVEEVVEDGETFEAGIQVAIQAILVSPNFLFKVESPVPIKPNEYPLVDDFELATRLSYFLWSSAPDNELLQLASKKQLREPSVLESQIKRMLAHKNSSRFVENFAGQWLTLRKLDEFKPNANQFPQWTDEIKALAKGETYRMVQHILQKDLSVLRLLDANFTFVNDKLAKFYGIPGVEGPEFRMVSTNGQKRMGILTHASILAVTSNPTRTSPVKRGKWVLENLLGTPPPPAPPGVPELEKSELKGTLRQQMEQHRADPSCASCHKLMDPIGMALENYDAIGRWRTLDRGQPIDTQGELPNGDSVNGPGDLIRSLREKSRDLFVRCLTEKLLTYSLGRGLEYYDRCAVDKILAATSKDEHRFSSLIYQIVLSDPFQRKGLKEEEL